MSELKIQNGDVITFIGLKWKELKSRKEISPAILLSPVMHYYEDDIELDTIINEALVDIHTEGKLRDMKVNEFSSGHSWNIKYLKHIAHLILKRKRHPDFKEKIQTGKHYKTIRKTYRFWRDKKGVFRYTPLNKNY